MANYRIASRTDTGRVRRVNEDSMVAFDSPNGHVVAVCDGMGGQAGGDVASKLACDVIRDILSNNTFASPQEAITRVMFAANQAILHRAGQDPALAGMGSTCVILIINGDVVTYGWVGDSRIYLLEDNVLRQVSRDESYVQALVDIGEITMVEARTHPKKNEIVNALGLRSMTPPAVSAVTVAPGQRKIFMLCSDGLSNMVCDKQIGRELAKDDITLQEKANKLVFLANQYGGQDNITLQLVEFGGATADDTRRRPRRKGRWGWIIAAILIVCAAVAALLFLSF